MFGQGWIYGRPDLGQKAEKHRIFCVLSDLSSDPTVCYLSNMSNIETAPKGRPPKKKNVFFRALPKLAPPPPPHMGYIRATWSSLFGRQKQRFAHMTEKNTDDDDDGWNDNNDGDDDNIDEIDEKNDQKHIQIMTFE